jgi:hypothetical protein
LGEIGEPGRCRRCLITTAPIEIAASAASAIRIGTRGEEELLLGAEAFLTGWACEPVVEPLPGLPWPVPPPAPVLGLPLISAVGPPDDDLC